MISWGKWWGGDEIGNHLTVADETHSSNFSFWSLNQNGFPHHHFHNAKFHSIY